jgi:malate dehydrogenase (oxaloacetate-decarboxylating)
VMSAANAAIAAAPPCQRAAIDVHVSGRALLVTPLLNKGSAFTEEERRTFGLLGLLPPHVSTLEEQMARAYENYQRADTVLERYIYLAALQDRNETLFHSLLQRHLAEMFPVIYTPGVGAGCQQYSHIYRRPRGVYIALPQLDDIDAILANASSPHAQLIVVTDGERILGLGDLGVGGMGIPIGKLTLYTACAGIDPAATLPIMLDVGTNNQALLNDPLYLGWRHPRVGGDRYDEFIEAFVTAVVRRFPNALLHWEDFSKANAARLLERYRTRVRSFNDDIQGTGAVALAGLLAAMSARRERLRDQRIVMLGAGSAGTGIAGQLVAAMVDEGVPLDEARSTIWLVDSQGLVHAGRVSLEASKRPYARTIESLRRAHLDPAGVLGLSEVVHRVKPTILIGTAGRPGAFSETVISAMARSKRHPIVFALSNPTSKSEAIPTDLVAWTHGRGLIATGSPFPGVPYDDVVIQIGQCNNAFIFPGVGLGVLASGATCVTGDMFLAAARALSSWAPIRRAPFEALYPSMASARDISRDVALAVGLEASRRGLADPVSPEDLRDRIEKRMWTPAYRPYRRAITQPCS